MRRRVRDHEELRSRDRIGRRVERAGLGWSFDRQARPPEDQEVEVELTRTPASTSKPTERSLEAFELGQELERSGRWFGGRVDLQGHDRIPELGLVDDPDGIRRVQARDAADPGVVEVSERLDGRGERPVGIPDVGAEADVRANSMVGHGSPVGRRIDSIP